MRYLICSFLLTLFVVVPTYACLNYYVLNKHGHLEDHHDSYIMMNIYKNFSPDEIEEDLTYLYNELVNAEDTLLLSDYAVTLLKGGKVKEGLKILQYLMVEYPKEYELAANLGTAYELNGQVDSALVYIQKGMELNPEAHGGSEWIHVKVLEAKKMLAMNPMYLKSNTVLGLTEEQMQEEDVLNQIITQLEERTPFSSAPDAIVGSLYADLAGCLAAQVSVEHALVYYDLAELYWGYENKEYLNEKRAEMNQLLEQYGDTLAKKRTEEGQDIDDIIPASYKELLEDRNTSGRIVSLDRYITDLDSLLSLMKGEEVTIDTPNQQASEAIPATHEKEEEKGYLFPVLISVIGAIAAIYIWTRMNWHKKNK